MNFSLNHMCSNVRDMDKTIDFYTRVMGGQITWQRTIEQNNSRYVYIQVADQLIEFSDPGVHDENTMYGLKHIAFETDDIDAAYTYLTDLGCTFPTPPKRAGSGNGRLTHCVDPFGISIEILQRDYTMYAKPIPSHLVCSFDHYAVDVADISKAHKFYHGKLMLDNVAHFELSDDRSLEIMYLSHGASMVELIQNNKKHTIENPHSHLAFRVNSIEEAIENLAKLGITLPDDAIKNAGIKVGRTINIYDPEGVRIELVERPDLRDFEKLGYTPETLETMRPF